MSKRKTILVVLGGGGHTLQLLKLIDKLGKEYDYEYVISSNDKISGNKIKIKGRIFRIVNPRMMEDKNIMKVVLKFIPSTIQVLLMFLKSKSSCILSAGPALSLHIIFLGKIIFRKKVIFTESWSRVYNKSWAGNAVYNLKLADLFFMQWPQQKKNYPDAIYAGRLG